MVMPFTAHPSSSFCTIGEPPLPNRFPGPIGSSYVQLITRLWGMSIALPIEGARVSNEGCRMNAVSSLFEYVYDTSPCNPPEKRLSNLTCRASYHDLPSPDRWLIDGVFGATLTNGRRGSSAPGPGSGTLTLRLRKIFAPRVPTYVTSTTASHGSCRCMPTLNICARFGLSPAGKKNTANPGGGWMVAVNGTC